MPDNELRVSITATTSGLSDGLADATAQVQTAAASMASAQEAATVAAKNLASAQTQLGSAAAAGNAAAAEVIAQYAEANVAAQVAVEQLTQVVAAQTPVMVANAGATTAAAAATQALGISGTRVATGVIGGMEGRFLSANRLAASFAATTLGLGPILQAAFPVIGALAFGEVLVDIGRGAYNAYEKFIDLDGVTTKLAEDVAKLKTADFLDVHSIETANERLDRANYLASSLKDTAQGLHDVSLKAFFGDLLQGNLTGAGIDLGQLVSARKIAGSGAESQMQSIALSVKQLDLEHQLAVAKIDAAHAGDAALTPQQKISAELSKQLALHKEARTYERDRERTMGNLSPVDAGAEIGAVEDQAARAKAAAEMSNVRESQQHAINEAIIQGVHASDAELPPLQRINAELEKTLALDREQANQKGGGVSEQGIRWIKDMAAQTKALTQENDALVERAVAEWTEGQKADEEATRKADQAHTRSVEEWKKGQEQKNAMVRDSAQAEITAAGVAFQVTELQVRQQEALGVISHRTATQMLLDAEALKEKTTQGALGKEQGLFNPAYGQEELREFTKLENQMTAEAQKSGLERMRLEQQETQRFMQLWKTATTAFNSDFTTALNAWATHQETAGKAFSTMLGTMEKQVMDFTAKTILEHAEMWLELKIMQALGLAQKKAADSTSNVAAVTGDASVAAAGTMAYWSAINPPIAPAMAALQYGLTMAYAGAAAFEAGGVVAGGHGMPVPIIAHAGERVLSAGQTSNFESMVNNSQRSSQARLNYSPTFNGGATDEHRQMARQEASSMMRGMLRPEAFR